MLYAALLLGFAGSLHCAGMCSPLMLAVTAKRPFLLPKVAYNTGRILTYGVLGMVAAGLGSLFTFVKYQQVLSFGMGAILVTLGFIGVSGVKVPVVTPLLIRLTNWVKQKFSWALGKSNVGSRFLMGMLNGLLPCGLTYIALTACFILPRAVDGLVYMLMFGIGTWPVMIGVGWVMQNAAIKGWVRNARLTQVTLILAGALLIARVWWVHQTHGNATDHPVAVGTTEVLCL